MAHSQESSGEGKGAGNEYSDALGEELSRLEEDLYQARAAAPDMTPQEYGRLRARREQGARDRLAALYPDKVTNREPIPEKPRAMHQGDLIRKAVSETQVPWPDEDVRTGDSQQRRGMGLHRISYYDPTRGRAGENIQAYNMFRRLSDTTESTRHAGNEGAYREGLSRLETAIFGEEGPELQSTDELLHGEAQTYEYFGQPIELTLDPDLRDGDSDFELYQVMMGQDEDDMTVSIQGWS